MKNFMHEFRGRVYTVREARLRKMAGDCNSPRCKNPQIRIQKDIGDRFELDTILHEGLHACLWDLDDEAVDKTAHALSRLLWKWGYRKNV